MHNFFSRSRKPAHDSTGSTPETRSAIGAKKRQTRMRGGILVAGSLVAVGALVGAGFVVQSNVEATNASIAATEVLTASTGRQSDQLAAYGIVSSARAKSKAKDTITVAKDAIGLAKGKADTATLSASVASLGNYELLTPGRIFELVDQTHAETTKVKKATKKAEELAAKKAAEQKAAAEKKAAEEAAAAKAAEEAAAQAAAEEAAANSAPVTGSAPSAPSNPSGAQAIARDMAASSYGWGDSQFGCLVALWDRESGWNANAYNASSGATGIPQALPGSKMASAGADWQTNPATQISWGLGYIAGSYGTPCAAWNHSESAGWY